VSNESERATLAALIGLHLVACSVSLVLVARLHPAEHIAYDPDKFLSAALLLTGFATIASSLLLAPFSFGYFVGFYFYTVVAGYLWLNCFSDSNYNHGLSGLSAIASIIAFLVPALHGRSPVRQLYSIEEASFDRFLSFSLGVGAVTVLIAASYGVRIVSLDRIYDFREQLALPTWLNYWIGACSNALLPFAFACFVLRRSYFRAAAVLAILPLFYPITLTKVSFFSAPWLLGMAVLSRIFSARITVVISLLGPMVLGIIGFLFFRHLAHGYFDIVNFRMLETPSSTMDMYNDFFFSHPATHFCQIGIVGALFGCHYQAPLAIVMAKTYGLGNMNASLLSTEGIASVGARFAPFAVFVCGLVIAMANRLSAELPPRLTLISSSIVVQIMLTVPLTITLLTNGAALLFLLWYVTPRDFFGENSIQLRRTSRPCDTSGRAGLT
jgi:hypothetical protein